MRTKKQRPRLDGRMSQIIVSEKELGPPIDVNFAQLGERDVDYKELQSSYVRDQFAKLQTASSARKWWTAIIFTVLFMVLSSSRWYEASSSLTELLKLGPTCNCHGPTSIGLFLHGLLFLLIVRWLLN